MQEFFWVVIQVTPDLSHAGVVCFVSIEALVDLFSQSSIFLWSPGRKERYATKALKTGANKFQCTLMDSILAVTNCRVLLQCITQGCNLFCQIFHHFIFVFILLRTIEGVQGGCIIQGEYLQI